MALTQNKIKALEAKVKQKYQKQDNANIQLQIPNVWADFARMVKIRSGGDIKPFDPFDYQIELVKLMQERSVCVVKSRQLGISETITCFMLWRACLNPGYLGLVFSKTQTDSSLLARRMKRMIASLGLKTVTENLSDIEIQGYGRCLFRNSRADSARGLESVCDVFYDEYAFLETATEVFNAVSPSQQMLGDKARTYVVSTPNGRSGAYFQMLTSGNGDKDVELLCTQASNGEGKAFDFWVDSGDWGKVLIHWKAHPIYGGDPNFLQKVHEKQKLSWQTINQEYNLSFQESDSNYFTADIVRRGAVGELENPIPNTFYFLGIDAATTGEDYATCVVLKCCDDGTFSLVHTYRKRQQSSEYHIYQISEIISKYKPTCTGLEVTGGTGQVWFENLVKLHPFEKITRIRTTGDSKPIMLDRVKLCLEVGKLIYPANNPLVDEMLNFKRNDKKLEAASGKHDDVLMGVAFALSVAETEGFL